MEKIKVLVLAQILALFMLAAAFYYWKGIPLVIAFALVWLDKAVLVHLKIHVYFGIELNAIAAVLAGMIYGPAFGFLFGFLILPLAGGIFEMASWVISPPMDITWIPVMPSATSLFLGLAGAVAGLLAGFPLVIVAAASTAVKNFFEYSYMKLTSEDPMQTNMARYILNLFFNILLALFIQKFAPGMFLPEFNMTVNATA